jgi:Tol biopolymer transport system component
VHRIPSTTVVTALVLALVSTSWLFPSTVYAAAGSTTRVSLTSTGGPAGGYSDGPVISRNGRVVVFVSQSPALDPAGTGATHLYARDRAAGTTEEVDIDPNGDAFAPTGLFGSYDVSDDGRYVSFVWATDPDDQSTMQAFRRDLVGDTTVLVGASESGDPLDDEVSAASISGDGSRIVFSSPATNVLDDGLGGGVFLRDLDTDRTVRLAQGGALDPDISADGDTATWSGPFDQTSAYVIWTGDLTDLDSISTARLVPGVDDESYSPTISADGQRVVFLSYGTGLDPTDTNSSYDWFFADRTTGTVELINKDTAGVQVQVARASLTDDGVHVGLLGGPLIAGEPRHSGLFVMDLDTGARSVAAVDSAGIPRDLRAENQYHYLSGDARYVAWSSPDRGWVPDDNDDAWDVFVHDNSVPADSASGTGTATTDGGDGATYLDPVVTTVTAPAGVVTIRELGSADSQPAVPTGYSILGQQVQITADPAPTGQFIDFVFRVDASTFDPRVDLGDVTVTRNGVALSRCGSSSEVGPCVLSVTRLADGDLGIEAHSPQASTWAAVLRTVPPDTTPPTITISSPSPALTVVKGQPLTAVYGCADESGGSGMATCTGTVPTGQRLDTGSVGTHVLKVDATDQAGNSATLSRSYRVRYPWAGFRAPVDDPPTVNRARAGTIVPVRFSLGGNQGPQVLAGAPTSASTSCQPRDRVDTVEQTLKSGAGTLRYDPSTRLYTYGWSVPRGWRGTCRNLALTLSDGTTHVARFTFVG